MIVADLLFAAVALLVVGSLASAVAFGEVIWEAKEFAGTGL